MSLNVNLSFKKRGKKQGLQFKRIKSQLWREKERKEMGKKRKLPK